MQQQELGGTINLEDDFMKDLRERLPDADSILGKGLNMPFNDTNSGARKILFGTQREHVIPIIQAETAYIQTGYEQKFGEESSSLIVASADAQVIAKIPKFSNLPNYHYYLILINDRTGQLDIIERISYKHITEAYGFRINNDALDNLKPGDRINKGAVLQKSVCYDKYNNRKDGINALTAYISLGQTEEDGIVISKSFAKRITTPLVHHVSVICNDNDIPLNLFGQGDVYKVLPDIGEKVPNGILCATRRENKEEILFSQAAIRLKDILMSDDKYTTNGYVADIKVHCNNPDNIENNPYYSQINYYYKQDMQFCQNLVNVVNGMGGVYPLSYSLNKMYTQCKQKIDGVQYIKDRPFSNIIVDLDVIEDIPIEVGDKLSDRYGGKGVVVAIWDDERMPKLSNGRIVDIIFNKSTSNNRLNVGQHFETSYNHICQQIIECMNKYNLSDDQCMDMYYKFLHYTNPQQEAYVRNYYNNLKEDDKKLYVIDIKSYDSFYQSLRPISDSCTLDKLEKLYEAFPWIHQYTVYVSMKDSNGNYRRVKARRPIVCGTKYIYRLKQYAEEKFSATSLSPTNIKNENSKSRANKLYRDPYTKTPIKFGEMESGNFGHMGFVPTVTNLLLYSSSPHARRLSGETLLTGDPFNIDVKLDKYSSNTEVQILNTRLKTIGLKLEFRKTPIKLKQPFIKMPFIKLKDRPEVPLWTPFLKLKNPTERDRELAHQLIDYQMGVTDGTGLMKPFAKMGVSHTNYKKIAGSCKLEDD